MEWDPTTMTQWLVTAVLTNGRVITASRLLVLLTYEGKGCGAPSKEENRLTRDALEHEIQRIFPSEPYIIIEPEITVYHHRPRPQFPQAVREYLEHPIEAMPELFIAAPFISLEPARDLDRHASVLVIGWFQRTFPPIIDERLLPKLQAIDWDRHAKDFYW